MGLHTISRSRKEVPRMVGVVELEASHILPTVVPFVPLWPMSTSPNHSSVYQGGEHRKVRCKGKRSSGGGGLHGVADGQTVIVSTKGVIFLHCKGRLI
jgi:hypothetical protein